MFETNGKASRIPVPALADTVRLMDDDRSAAALRLKSGNLHGKVCAGVEQYRGVPYAAAPVRERRFALPEPARWDGEFDATGAGATAPHRVRNLPGQRRDGSFNGFLLIPGASTHWITAHVAYVLEDVPEAEDICFAAATYLSNVLETKGACGYNERVGRDCDSTAQALLVVRRHGLSFPGSALDWLLAAQRPEGGFPTYSSPYDEPPPTGWHQPHPDVTAMALIALNRLGAPREAIERASDWLATQANRGLLPAYWWGDPSYGRWVQHRSEFRADHAAAAATDELSQVMTVPQIAMLAVAAAQSDARILGRIIQSQCRDGGWDCAPCLKVTDPRCDRAALGNPGRVYSDRTRIFSTAHAVTAVASSATLREAVTAPQS